MREGYVILTEEVDDREADIVVSMLQAYGIPAEKEFSGASSVLKVCLGTATYGVKVVVPKEKLQQAKELLEAEPALDDMEEEFGDEEG